MQNHEVWAECPILWAECPICGSEYDLRNGDVCPDCNTGIVNELAMGGEFHPTNKNTE